ncbi:WD40 repeat-like protein [Viridothelium virens]|uniref:WD40 repeat-like protein n=1 Tax=Viridothelium virens TaxID=1048519 RepID=A0A6A6H7I5_VIRVR|nr:WD40 repeat-like protein [Viridothelium virens]
MKFSLHDRLLKRELGTSEKRYSKVRGIYGDRQWVNNLDIVNELNGHSGCVNALSWSKTGRLLASGSDDQFVNIHAYQPEDAANQFSLTTAISTGHTANIFSVKFMPHTNDRTLVTAAGDAEVRIFDIEYSGQAANSTTRSHLAHAGRRRGRNNHLEGVRYLSEGDTNARVYRSHGDRVKRIVTESSPHLFLTCSEDGEVRQWDLRQPSSAYPPPHFGRGPSAASDNVPAPLISYKQYDLDLNTISCSPSQPHYIALGGAHLHCFLHDRRMLGRDRLREMGGGMSPASSRSDQQDDLLGRATQCVRKFAPNGQKKMKKTDNGHITACKISDANPNELIASWSGDFIYSFDLVRSPDAGEEQESVKIAGGRTTKSKESKERKRKTKPGSTTSREGAVRAGSRARVVPTDADGDPSSMALRVQYGNGQSEEIPIEAPRARSPETEAREVLIPEARRQSFRIAKGMVTIRKTLFSMSEATEPSVTDPTGYASSFSSVLGHAASLLPDMDEIMKAWRYPMNPHEIDVHFQRTLQRNRASAWRFVQAAGTLSRVLGGRLQVAGGQQTLAFQHFAQIRPAPGEGAIITTREQFGYDFIKAILLWLEGGVGGLLRGFAVTDSPVHRLNKNPGPRYPVPEDATADAVDLILIPYLKGLAGKRPVIAVDTSRFEVDENRILFESEEAAVTAFAQVVAVPFEDLSGAVRSASAAGEQPSAKRAAQDRRTALKFWGLKVARDLLMNAAEGVNFAFVDRAFGGLGRPNAAIREEEQSLQLLSEKIDGDAPEEEVRTIEVTRTSAGQADPASVPLPAEAVGEAVREESIRDLQPSVSEADGENGEASESMSIDPQGANEYVEDDGDEDVEEEEGDDGTSETDEDSDEGDDEDTAMGNIFSSGPFLRQSTFNRRAMREKVEQDVPCSAHTRIYRGHCNVRTVKDVNFFGLQDEYVVSGSDSGHVFIWDKKTARLVNILEGDGEVVNVVQGHPYEPTLAVSGIDHTVKIFSPDGHARENACKGIGVSASDASTFSSINFGRRRSRPSQTAQQAATPTSETAGPGQSTRNTDGNASDDEEPAVTANGLSSRKRMNQEYEITSQNDVDRRGGNQDVYITVWELLSL